MAVELRLRRRRVLPLEREVVEREEARDIFATLQRSLASKGSEIGAVLVVALDVDGRGNLDDGARARRFGDTPEEWTRVGQVVKDVQDHNQIELGTRPLKELPEVLLHELHVPDTGAALDELRAA